MKTILFYWSKGANVRRDIISLIHKCSEREEPCFLNYLSKKLKLTHVAVKRHLDLLIENGYIKQMNPKGKPVYLQLTSKGKDIIKEFKKG